MPDNFYTALAIAFLFTGVGLWAYAMSFNLAREPERTVSFRFLVGGVALMMLAIPAMMLSVSHAQDERRAVLYGGSQ